MFYKVGTVKEMESVKQILSSELYQAVWDIVTSLDGNYGAERDVEEEDGGFVLILQNIQDIEEAADWCIQLDKDTHEHVSLVKCAVGDYINVLYLMNNEFGVNVFLPKDIAPQVLLEDLENNNG